MVCEKCMKLSRRGRWTGVRKKKLESELGFNARICSDISCWWPLGMTVDEVKLSASSCRWLVPTVRFSITNSWNRSSGHPTRAFHFLLIKAFWLLVPARVDITSSTSNQSFRPCQMLKAPKAFWKNFWVHWKIRISNFVASTSKAFLYSIIKSPSTSNRVSLNEVSTSAVRGFVNNLVFYQQRDLP